MNVSMYLWSPIPECNNLNGEELMCYTELVTPHVDKYALI